LFKTKLVPGKEGAGTLFEEEYVQEKGGPVTCLGMTFENDESRRAHFTDELREKLQDPEFRKIEGFPIGEDEDILSLSDPPYYTACPNPWIADFIEEWENEKPEKPDGYTYHREPFAADVSEGKNDPIYNAHSYHTKVPHKAIMRYILHYTEPGDIVFDGFAGTGMTGVAAQMCGDREMVVSLGYQVLSDGTILREEIEEGGKKAWKPFSMLGERQVILNDLSPAATYIGRNFNTPVSRAIFMQEAERIIEEVKHEYGWMYETHHENGEVCSINFVVWSDVFLCSYCQNQVVFWDIALDPSASSIKKELKCNHCGSTLDKRKLERSWSTEYDHVVNKSVSVAREVPAIINYSYKGKRYEKVPDQKDLDNLARILDEKITNWVPNMELPNGYNLRQPKESHGVSYIHQFYTKRNLIVMSAFWEKVQKAKYRCPHLGLWFTSTHAWGTRLGRLLVSNYFNKKGGVIAPALQGTLYISSLSIETNLIDRFALRVKSSPFTSAFDNAVIETCSLSESSIPDSSVDYVFVDPPFGGNRMYSELNILWETWLAVLTNATPEAIENSVHKKSVDEYRALISACFNEIYRTLKPGRWMTVEFSNTSAAVWNSIQAAISEAGFIVANVSILEKKHKGFKAVTTPTAVKQDLAITAYKPNGGFEERFQKEAGTEEGVWDFIRTHLAYLPVIKQDGALIQFIPERDPRILFDQMVAYYVRKGYPVPLSSQEFQQGLAQHFIERDGMFFLTDQVAEYDRKKMHSGQLSQESLFVSDESSAIQWLRQLLKQKPQQFSDINPIFMKQLGGWSKNESQLDLRELLNQNFLCYDGTGPVPEQIHAYLSSNWKELRNLSKDDHALVAKAKDRWYVPDPNKAGDLEKLRERALLKEFEEYKQSKTKLKVFRLEAVRAGCKKAWEDRDYTTIIEVAGKIPTNVLEEDPKLLMWYDLAVTRIGDE